MAMHGWATDLWNKVKDIAGDFANFPVKAKERLRDVSPNGSLYDYITSSKGLVEDVLMGSGFKKERLAEFARQMRETQDTLDLMYNRVQTYRKYPAAARAAGVDVEALAKVQEEGYSRFQYMNFWAQVVPYIHDALKAAGVRPADYRNASENSPLIVAFAYWSGIDENIQKYRDAGQLRGLGMPVAGIAAICVAAIAFAYFGFEAWRQIALTWRNGQDKGSMKPLVECVAKGGEAAKECAGALKEMGQENLMREKQDREGGENTLGDLKNILMWGAVIGAGLIFLPTLLEAGKSGAKAIRERREAAPAPAMAGWRRSRHSRGLRGAPESRKFLSDKYEELRGELRELSAKRPGFDPRLASKYERLLRKMEKLNREIRKAKA